MKIVKTNSTSAHTMQVTPIILRESTITRLVFHPILIHQNPHNPDANLKGCFVFQRKGANDSWEDITGETLSSLKKGEGYKLEISSEEFLKLIQESETIKKLYKQYGFLYYERNFIITENNVDGVFLQISDFKNKELVVANLKKLEKNNFENLQSLLGLAKIDKILGQWEKNNSNCKEDDWQKLFQDNVWVLQQIFSYPVIILQGETYVGGKNTKGRSGQGGVATDFIGQDQSTNSFAVIEIKTPCSKIVGSIYRGEMDSGNTNESYSMDTELSGGVVQLQNQLDTAIKNFPTTLGEDFSKQNLNYLNPHGVLIIGTLVELTEAQKKSFFLFRKTVRDITIITFDELFKKIKFLKKIFND